MRRPSARALAPLALTLALAALLLAAAPAQPAAPPLAPSALEPPGTGGIALLDRALAKLTTHRRLLIIAAHPDDEDTSLLTLVSRGMGGEAAYLSLSRGDGGQNLIGSELGVGLGVLRSRELEAARAIDGGRQFFTRAYDFGYTRSLPETLRRWPRGELLRDMVRVIRRFKPQLVVAVFPGDGRAGHGQHEVSGLLAPEAFRLAGDPDAFPELAVEGLDPWSPVAFFRSAWWDREGEGVLEQPTGALEATSGHSLYQVAMASRSQHRSQDMGRLLEIGPSATRLRWEAGREGVGAAGDPFAGVDVELPAIAALLPEGATQREVAARLTRVEAEATALRERLAPAAMAAAAEPLAGIVDELEAARAALGSAGSGAQRQVASLLEEKIAVASEALAAAAGVVLDATSEQETVVAGEPLVVNAELWRAGETAVGPCALTLESSAGWTVPLGAELAPGPGELAEHTFELTVAGDALPTRPYFLERPLAGDLYDWSEAPPAVRGEPFGPPPLTVRCALTVAGVAIVLEREVVHRHRDQAEGEVRRPLRLVPALEVAVEPELLVWPTDDPAARPLEVILTLHGATPATGELEVRVPAGWPAPDPIPFDFAAGGSRRRALTVPLEPPAQLTPGRYRLGVTAHLGGTDYATAYPLVDYPHIRPTPLPEPAVVNVTVADLVLPRLGRVGYVRGASDRVPELLERVGVPLELLAADDLTDRDLDAYDVLVIGTRAYETEPALARANPRLLDYARRGGTLIVQYQQYQFVRGEYAPLPLTIARPHGRVTDETAPVTLLEPEHPVFRYPNPIGPGDWLGWVQERGLYFADSWDDAYQPLLAMADPGEDEQRGALLVAPLGKGTYVYTGLAFFRQLPAGVPGAYRLFANLLALGEKGASGAAPATVSGAPGAGAGAAANGGDASGDAMATGGAGGGSPAAGLLAASIAHHDPQGRFAEGAFRLEMTESRPDGSARQTTFTLDNATGRAKLRREADGVVTEGTISDGECSWTLDGRGDFSDAEAEQHRLTCERLELLRNYYLYLWGLPMKLRDPGTRLAPEVERTTFEGRPVDALEVTYDPEVGHHTWRFYLDAETHALVGYRFFTEGPTADGEYIVLEGETPGAGLRLPKRRTWYTNKDDRLLGTDTLRSLEPLER